MLRGSATAAGTVAYRAALGGVARNGHFREWRGLALSSVGIGTYLGRDDDVTDALYEAAIERALALGNQRRRFGRQLSPPAERARGGPGARQARGRGTGRARRCRGRRPRAASCPSRGRAPPGLLAAGDLVGGCHCITPRYLEDQIERSRANLGLETIDVYYLHNPETQLGEVSRPVFMRRLRAAFEFLESAARDGSIGVYGTATWSGYRQPPSAPRFPLAARRGRRWPRRWADPSTTSAWSSCRTTSP